MSLKIIITDIWLPDADIWNIFSSFVWRLCHSDAGEMDQPEFNLDQS